MACAAGAVVGLAAALSAPWQTVPLLAWDATAFTWAAMVWWPIRRLDAIGTRSHATCEDPGRATADAVLLSASVISLVAVVLGVLKAGTSHGAGKAILLGAGIVTVIIAATINLAAGLAK